ncbi:hypothetical protein BY996DRAFT_6492071 [Phakopsora pachyrhizi]|uniref:Uncharacterized protein n=1 Tax=Phakopsora pachyrhizi TaxID=170000 RepID=A0AAV0BPJ6_PHAPC|nr:hypothetical protein BY996DRAFT_6492071 [Phakopsora pachyrhizi]CAH7689288.1 hypothetical protein PPACK8108_LOCUS24336 [Phakopsora pachyrhizi]
MISNDSYHGLLMTSMTAVDQSMISTCPRHLFQSSRMDRETDEIDLPQNSDCSKLGDQNNKMNEEEESEVLMVRLKEGLKEAMRS